MSQIFFVYYCAANCGIDCGNGCNKYVCRNYCGHNDDIILCGIALCGGNCNTRPGSGCNNQCASNCDINCDSICFGSSCSAFKKKTKKYSPANGRRNYLDS